MTSHASNTSAALEARRSQLRRHVVTYIVALVTFAMLLSGCVRPFTADATKGTRQLRTQITIETTPAKSRQGVIDPMTAKTVEDRTSSVGISNQVFATSTSTAGQVSYSKPTQDGIFSPLSSPTPRDLTVQSAALAISTPLSHRASPIATSPSPDVATNAALLIFFTVVTYYLVSPVYLAQTGVASIAVGPILTIAVATIIATATLYLVDDLTRPGRGITLPDLSKLLPTPKLGPDRAPDKQDGTGPSIPRLPIPPGLPDPQEINPLHDPESDISDCLKVDSAAGFVDCLDEGAPQQTPEPEPQAGGAGRRLPPKSCIDKAAAKKLLDESNINTHHLATNKNKVRPDRWTLEFERVAGDFNLKLTEPWNKVKIRHAGPHPAQYHQWVLDNMTVAAGIAETEPTPELQQAKFLELFKAWVADVVEKDPTIVRRDYWKCYE